VQHGCPAKPRLRGATRHREVVVKRVCRILLYLKGDSRSPDSERGIEALHKRAGILEQYAFHHQNSIQEPGRNLHHLFILISRQF